MDITNTNHEEDSTDDDLSNQQNQPVNSSTIITRQQGDSGIELDQTSSSSTIYNQQTNKDQLLFPPVNHDIDETSQPTLLHHVQKQIELDNENLRKNQDQLSTKLIHVNPLDTYWDRLKQNWFYSLLTGLFILLLLFFIYLSALDKCSRSTFIQSVCRKIIYIENEGLPTI
jgi:hypothetical protein